MVAEGRWMQFEQGVNESVKRMWSGDVDLNDGELQ